MKTRLNSYDVFFALAFSPRIIFCGSGRSESAMSQGVNLSEISEMIATIVRVIGIGGIERSSVLN